jgi:hypothetical protein
VDVRIDADLVRLDWALKVLSAEGTVLSGGLGGQRPVVARGHARTRRNIKKFGSSRSGAPLLLHGGPQAVLTLPPWKQRDVE